LDFYSLDHFLEHLDLSIFIPLLEGHLLHLSLSLLLILCLSVLEFLVHALHLVPLRSQIRDLDDLVLHVGLYHRQVIIELLELRIQTLLLLKQFLLQLLQLSVFIFMVRNFVVVLASVVF
jgi:hypothetical protein